jgi:hypothetical protein
MWCQHGHNPQERGRRGKQRRGELTFMEDQRSWVMRWLPEHREELRAKNGLSTANGRPNCLPSSAGGRREGTAGRHHLGRRDGPAVA